jgi:hypothetical protein
LAATVSRASSGYAEGGNGGLAGVCCCLALTALVLSMIVAAMPVRAQPAQEPWRPEAKPDVRPLLRPALPGADSIPFAPNVTVVPRSGSAPGAGAQEVKLTAFLVNDGPPIDQGLVWNLFQDSDRDSAPLKHIRTVRDASPLLRLSPGRYLVNVSFGRANMTRSLTILPGASLSERFVLNAGGIRVNAVLCDGAPAPEMAVSYDIYSGESDQLGNRRRIMSGARPGLIMRLNAGIFHIVSRYGDANAVVSADVTVEAGKLTEVAITHPGATVTFRLVTRAGGEAQSGAQWAILDGDGDVIKESAGALPTHVLAAGSYVITARHSGRVFRQGFTVKAGDVTQVELVMK